MGVQNVGDLSLGQWSAIIHGWDEAHGDKKIAPPTEDEFEAAVLAARG